MIWYNKDKTIGININDIDFFRFTPEVSRPSRLESLDQLEITIYGCPKTLFGASARELFKILSTKQQ